MHWYTAAPQLVDTDTARAAWLALQSDVEAFEPPASPAPELVDPVADAFDSVGAATEGLAALETRLRTHGDRRAVFLTIYRRSRPSTSDFDPEG